MQSFEQYLTQTIAKPIAVEDVENALKSPDKVFYVSSGHLDLFFRETGDTLSAGRLHPLFRIEKGEWLFCFNESNPTFELSTMGGTQTQVFEFQIGQIEDLLKDEKHAAEVGNCIENWVEKIYSGFPLKQPNRHSVVRQLDITTLPKGKILVPRHGIMWISITEGKARLLGESEFSAEQHAHQWIPVTDDGWLEAIEELKFQNLKTADLLKNRTWFDALKLFHRWVQNRLPTSIQAKMDQELDRLQMKSNADEKLLTKTIEDLSDILQPQAREAQLIRTTEDPLEVAALLVAEAGGIKLNLKAKKDPDYHKDALGNLARNSRVRFRTVLLNSDWWQYDNGPLLGYLENNGQPVAILPVGKRKYQLVDPVNKTAIPITAEVAATLEGQAKMFYRPLPDKKLNLKDLLGYAKHSIVGDLWVVFLTGLAGGIMGMITPFATGLIFDSAIPKANRNELIYIGMALFICALSTLLFHLTRSIAMLRFEGKVDASLQAAIWDRLLSLPIPFFRDFTSGDLADRALGINQIRSQISGTVIVTIVSSIFSIFYFFQLYYYSWELALVGMVLTLIAVLPAGLSILKIRYERQSTALEGKLTGLVFQFILGVTKIRTSGAERRAFTNWADLFGKKQRLTIKIGTLQNIIISWNEIFPLLASMTIFAYIVYYIDDPMALSTGEFLAFNSAFALFIGSVLAMSDAGVSVLKVIPLYERSKPILEALPEHDETLGDPGVLTGNVEVSNVSFRYAEDGPLILHEVSFKIEPGSFVALVGPSGSGKSTMFRLLLGFEHPESGEIFYDGQQLSGLDIRSVRRQIGVVLQNGQLMSGDIFSNIVGSLPLKLDDAWDAAKMAGLDTDIQDMPMGMHTMVSEGAGTLSGGQVQRLLIARALVNKPRILFFDEATSALDNQTQSIVSKSIDQLDVTRVVIAHRLSTILNADLILVMEKGRLVQSGTYKELLNQPGVFAELAKRQLA